jgi:hypothetical protein
LASIVTNIIDSDSLSPSSLHIATLNNRTRAISIIFVTFNFSCLVKSKIKAAMNSLLLFGKTLFCKLPKLSRETE